MGWWFLLLAGLLEIGWPVGFKYAASPEGFRWIPAAAGVASMIASFAFMLLAQSTIPIGTCYAVWTGIGTVGAATLGIILFHEPATAARLVCISLIVIGVLGLKFTAPPEEVPASASAAPAMAAPRPSAAS